MMVSSRWKYPSYMFFRVSNFNESSVILILVELFYIMRLIKNATMLLEVFITGGSHAPTYAVLSHTWKGDEVSLYDFVSLSEEEKVRKKGYAKIQRNCERARKVVLDCSRSKPAVSTRPALRSSPKPSTPYPSGIWTLLFATSSL